MDALHFFLDAYEVVRGEIQRLDQREESLWRARPQGLNSIAWLVWHLARFEDVAINRLVVEGTQVLDDPAACWPSRMGAPWRDVGVGMTDAEVTALTEGVDLGALRAYSAAVGQQTRQVARCVAPESLDAVVDLAYLRRVLFEEGALRPEAAWVEEVMLGWTKGRCLSYFALLHNAGHMYDKRTVLSLLGIPGR
jgi:hypothetical protein